MPSNFIWVPVTETSAGIEIKDPWVGVALERLLLYPTARAELDRAVAGLREATNETAMRERQALSLSNALDESANREKILKEMGAKAGKVERMRGARDGAAWVALAGLGAGLGLLFGGDAKGAGIGALAGAGAGAGVVLIAFPIIDKKADEAIKKSTR